MKLKILTMLSILTIGFTACNSDRQTNGNGNGNGDTMMTDSAVMDTAGTGTGTGTTGTGTGTTGTGTDTTKRDTTQPMR